MTTFTVNTGLVVDPTGSNVGVWASNVTNPDFVAIDGLFAGVQAISVSNVPVTLTAPAAFVATPSGGPTQAQNRVLRFTGAMTGNVRITLPLPGSYIIENLTTGNFVLSFQGVTATEVIGIEQGIPTEIYNDGANVRFANLGSLGKTEMWSGVTTMPTWVAACTKRPYLLCDGSIYNFSDFPYLGARMGGNFGGNGVTTFGVPDLRGRVPLAYDGTGARITVAGCGLNGQTIGASIDTQSVVLGPTQIPLHTHPNILNDPGHVHPYQKPSPFGASGSGAGIFGTSASDNTGPAFTGMSITNANNVGGGGSHPNVQPSQIIGIQVIRAA